MAWQYVEPLRLTITQIGGRIGAGQITPALVRALRMRAHGHETGCQPDPDPAPVRIIRKAKDFAARDQPVLDDPVERSTDQLGIALGPEARDDEGLACRRAPLEPLAERVRICAPNGDLGEMKQHPAKMGAVGKRGKISAG
jgi:hypothetical protein